MCVLCPCLLPPLYWIPIMIIARQNSASVCFVMCVLFLRPSAQKRQYWRGLRTVTLRHPPHTPTHTHSYTHTHTYAHSPHPPPPLHTTTTPLQHPPAFTFLLIDNDFTTAFDDSLFPVRPSNTDLASDRFFWVSLERGCHSWAPLISGRFWVMGTCCGLPIRSKQTLRQPGLCLCLHPQRRPAFVCCIVCHSMAQSWKSCTAFTGLGKLRRCTRRVWKCHCCRYLKLVLPCCWHFGKCHQILFLVAEMSFR